ncbi:hypothetical protein FQZ97_774290 [compost metagenome]
MLPALGGGITLEVGIHRDEKLQPAVARPRIGLHIALGQRQRLGRLPQPLVGLHQHLQDLFPGRRLLRRQQADDPGVAPFDQVEPGQIQLLAGLQLGVQFAAPDGLAKQFDGLGILPFGPGQVTAAAPQQGLFQAVRLGLGRIQRPSRRGIVALLLSLLGRVQGTEYPRLDALPGGLHGPRRAQNP